MKSLWLTRPRTDSEALAAMLDVPSIIAPVMHVLPVAIADLGAKPDGLIFTSRHALFAPIPVQWRDLPAYCVGEATLALAQECGFAHAMNGGGDAISLATYIADHAAVASTLLYLCGEETRVDMVSILAARGIVTRTEIAYQTVAEPTMPTALLDAFGNNHLGGVVCFSPRSAQLVTDVMRQLQLTSRAPEIDAYCLSVAVAAEAGKLPWRALKVAHNPTTRAMVELIHASAIEDV